MMLDKNEFFRQATLRICGSLQIEEALFSSVQFLKEVMPVDMILLQFVVEDQTAYRTVAIADEKEGKAIDTVVPLSPEAQQVLQHYINEYRQHHEQNHVWLFDKDPKAQSVTREVFDFHDKEATSLMVMPLEAVKDKVIGGGSLWLSTQGDRKFTKKHADLLSLLREPFSLAMSNALRYRSELRLLDREFFREVTMRICGNLEIEEGLREIMELLVEHMPADRIYLERYEPDLGSMRVVAQATTSKGERMDVLLPLPEEGRAEMLEASEAMKSGTFPVVNIINKPQEEPMARYLLESLGLPLSSILGIPLVLEGRVEGAVVLLAEGEDRYSEDHARLFAHLKIPFFVAMSNTMKHREILKLKDLLADDNRYLRGELRRLSGDEIIGANFGLKNVMHKVRQVASLDSPVLLLGETGVGKDVIANTIHYSSSRSSGPFVSVNCGAIPDTLIDSELFGHEKGAFTGALSQKRGRFERADKGTIFLDEIGELPPQAQVRLLRVLQSREIERVGGDKTIPLDIRIIAATNRNLEEMVQVNTFREDLWFRLNVFPIWIPPLRERTGDIPALLQHFISLKSKELNLQAIPTVSPGAIDALMQYHWPGNVREMENIIERAIILNPQGPLTFDDSNLSYQRKAPAQSPPTSTSVKLDEVIAAHIQSVLTMTNGKIHGPGGAADLLGVNANTLRNRMNKLGIRYGRGRKNQTQGN
jgi:transcriptional regulator with GAF, ATPase, and Fis domain